MMVIDTSALMAIQFGEPEAQRFRSLMRPRMMVGAPTLLEYYLVVGGRYGAIGRLEAEALVERLDLAVINFTEEMVQIASDAFMRFGKGKHKAKLNFGDCMAYAVAKSLDAPLLFKGGDFALTDVISAT
jgi:ribonuclease VapC